MKDVAFKIEHAFREILFPVSTGWKFKVAGYVVSATFSMATDDSQSPMYQFPIYNVETTKHRRTPIENLFNLNANWTYGKNVFNFIAGARLLWNYKRFSTKTFCNIFLFAFFT